MTGIYFLKQGETVVYVGQSINIEQRVKQHTDKEFDSYHYIECPEELLDSTEMAYITKHQPEYNVIGVDSRLIKSYEIKPKYEVLGMKVIKIEDEAHAIAKARAKAKGMTLQGYIKMLILNDKK